MTKTIYPTPQTMPSHSDPFRRAYGYDLAGNRVEVRALHVHTDRGVEIGLQVGNQEPVFFDLQGLGQLLANLRQVGINAWEVDQ